MNPRTTLFATRTERGVMVEMGHGRTIMVETSWNVRRTGRVEEVSLPGGSVRYRVKVWDAGRDAFITKWFNDPIPAQDFLRRLKAENEAQGAPADSIG